MVFTPVSDSSRMFLLCNTLNSVASILINMRMLLLCRADIRAFVCVSQYISTAPISDRTAAAITVFSPLVADGRCCSL